MWDAFQELNWLSRWKERANTEFNTKFTLLSLGAGGVTECVDRPDWDVFVQVDAGSAWEVKTEETECEIFLQIMMSR